MTEAASQEQFHKSIHYPGRYIPGIDGLRAIAVLSVILFHLNASLLPGGFVGVDVFFVISGYVISRSLAKSKAPSFHLFVLDFYKRRVLRIFPALVVCLVLTGIFTKLFIPQGFWLSESNNSTGLWAFFGISNFFLVNHADGYFSARIPFNPYVHTWSLAVEEQFYVFFPLIFYLWLRLRSNGNKHHRIVFAVLPTIALLSLAWAAHETHAAHERAFYLLPSRFWELAAGAILYQFHSYRPNNFNQASRWLNPLGVLLLAMGLILANEDNFPFPWAVVPVSGAVLLIAGVATTKSGKSIVGRLLAGRTLSYIGRISYSLYLWHWPVFVIFRWTLGLSTPAYWLLALVLTSALAILSYHFIEVGFRSSRLLTRQPSWRIVGGGALTACCAFFLVTQLFYSNYLRGMSLSVTNDKCLWEPYDFQCLHELKASPINRSLFVIGDSHTGAYTLMANVAANRLGAKTYIQSFSGCPIADLISVNHGKSQCSDYEKITLDWLDSRAKPGDIVFLASLRSHRLGDQWGAFEIDKVLAEALSQNQAGIDKQAFAEAESLVMQLKARGLNVLLDAPKPIFKSPSFRCSDWFNKNNPVCAVGLTIDRDFLLKFREPVMKSLRALHKELGVYLWDPFPILCPQATCSAFDGNMPKFSDGDHLSGYGNRLLVDSFTERLSSIWGLDKMTGTIVTTFK